MTLAASICIKAGRGEAIEKFSKSWEMMYNVIFLITSNFPIVSTLLWETEIL